MSPNEIRIGVVGGSTVECAALAPRKRWSDILERLLSEVDSGQRVAVLNLGVSSQSTRTHLAVVAQHAVELDLNYLVFMLGANDLFRVDSTNPMLRDDAFAPQGCRCARSFLLQFQLARRLQILYRRLKGQGFFVNAHEPEKPYFEKLIKERLSLPVLPTAKSTISNRQLKDYELNIVSLAGLAIAHGITPIFTTQPMLLKPVLTPEKEAVDWLVGVTTKDGRRYRGPAGEQAQALEDLNRQLLETCAHRSLKCIDLAQKIPRTLQYFYDSVHLNEARADTAAHEVAAFIAHEGPEFAAIEALRRAH